MSIYNQNGLEMVKVLAVFLDLFLGTSLQSTAGGTYSGDGAEGLTFAEPPFPGWDRRYRIRRRKKMFGSVKVSK